MLRHKKCNGQIIISVSNQLRIVSPGVKINPKGIQPGIVELQKVGSKGGPSWLCKKCGEEFKTEEELNQIEIQCYACNEYHNIDDVLVTQYGMFDSNCHDILSGEVEGPLDEYFEHLKEVISIDKSSDRVPLIKLMLKPINI